MAGKPEHTNKPNTQPSPDCLFLFVIVRRIRELGVYSEMAPWTKAESVIAERRDRDLAAVVLSGGPNSVLDSGAPDFDPRVLDGLPVLGICYGHQWLAHRLGGQVEKVDDREYGRRHLRAVKPRALVADLTSDQVWMSHGDQVLKEPPGFEVTASTDSCPIAAFEDRERHRFGVQFHPEVSHTPDGSTVLKRFLFDEAGLPAALVRLNLLNLS